jgi:hypothetical protein
MGVILLPRRVERGSGQGVSIWLAAARIGWIRLNEAMARTVWTLPTWGALATGKKTAGEGQTGGRTLDVVGYEAIESGCPGTRWAGTSGMMSRPVMPLTMTTAAIPSNTWNSAEYSNGSDSMTSVTRP